MAPEVRAYQRESAVTELLEIAKLADDDQMHAELEDLAARFSVPPGEYEDRSAGKVGKAVEEALTKKFRQVCWSTGAADDHARSATKEVLAAIQPFLVQPEGDGLEEALHAKLDAIVRPSDGLLGGDDYERGVAWAVAELRRWLSGRTAAAASPQPEDRGGKLVEHDRGIDYRPNEDRGGVEEGLNALGEIAARVGRIRCYLSTDFGEVDVPQALRDADDAAEFFNTVRAALRSTQLQLSDEDRANLRKAAQLIAESTDGPDSYSDGLITFLSKLASTPTQQSKENQSS